MYTCNCCAYETTIKYCFEKHKLSKKHMKKVEGIVEEIVEEEVENVEEEVEKVEVIVEEIVEEEVEKVEEEEVEKVEEEVEEEPDQKNKTFEYYQKYLILYNELDMFRKNNCESIHQGTSDWIQQMRILNTQFRDWRGTPQM